MNDAKPQTATELNRAIADIIAERALGAAQSQYDRSVCIRAVGVARTVFESIPIRGTAAAYGEEVLAALLPVYEAYNDSGGEYTSGKSSIGDVYYDIGTLLRIE